MFKKISIIMSLVAVTLLSGCASVPMASNDEDKAVKEFQKPQDGKAGLYIYRNTFVGQALKKNVYINGKLVGETANKTFFYKELAPGAYELATESEFSENNANLKVEPGQLYFVEQKIKMGVFVGGAALEQVDSETGMKNVLQCKLAKETDKEFYLKKATTN
ncbi:DUF2846 domain-containing protein [Shewanella cyperi]|uniref:DUF2846 domain-containing protein n=1 Tax=Shewanella cyperi TaxID=2814292 RepID=UPI001A93DCC9|nr:DUF2846 domain-containing protein [Shewanella cyperi]QSX41214.1 DUF2846 domain-containing protein [Shewanella cyperi]